MYAEHVAAGTMREAEPDATCVYGGDEVGFNPAGKWSRRLSFAWDKNHYTVGLGEKAPFWASFWCALHPKPQTPAPKI